jgi:hypothetical protein
MAITNATKTALPHKDIWETDPRIVRAIERLLGLRFELDICGTPHNAKAPRVITLDPRYRHDCNLPVRNPRIYWDALATDWHKLARVAWMNPPFTKKHLFIAKAEREARRGMIIIAPLPVATVTHWYRDMEQGADRLLMPERRVNYIHPMTGRIIGGCNFETVFAIWQPRTTIQIERITIGAAA